MSPLYTTQIPAVQTVADLCFTWLCSWTNCWCLSLEGLLSTLPPQPLILTCLPWYSLNSTLENSVKSQTEKILAYWWNSFPFNSIPQFCILKTLIHLVSLGRVQYWIGNDVRWGQEAQEPPTVSSSSVVFLLVQHMHSRLQGVQMAVRVAGLFPPLQLSRMWLGL